jgi:hypothetical protein
MRIGSEGIKVSFVRPFNQPFNCCILINHGTNNNIILRLCQLCDHAIAIILIFGVLYKIDTPAVNGEKRG